MSNTLSPLTSSCSRPDEKGKFVVPNAIVFQEALALLAEGREVTLPFKGLSMEPTLHSDSDKVVLAPVSRPLRRLDVVLYRKGDDYLLHRIIRIRKDKIILRGDACADKEEIAPTDVKGILTHIKRENGTLQACAGTEWRRKSRRVVCHNALHQWGHRYFSQQQRRRLAPYYFLLLAILMWSPLGALGKPLDNFVFGIRLDHLVHASIYIFCTWFLMDIRRLRGWQIWLLGCLVGVITESVQYLLPYRGFDINDMAANFLGVSLGWCVVLWLHGRPSVKAVHRRGQ